MLTNARREKEERNQEVNVTGSAKGKLCTGNGPRFTSLYATERIATSKRISVEAKSRKSLAQTYWTEARLDERWSSTSEPTGAVRVLQTYMEIS